MPEEKKLKCFGAFDGSVGEAFKRKTPRHSSCLALLVFAVYRLTWAPTRMRATLRQIVFCFSPALIM